MTADNMRKWRIHSRNQRGRNTAEYMNAILTKIVVGGIYLDPVLDLTS
jgi:hypothetical protein